MFNLARLDYKLKNTRTVDAILAMYRSVELSGDEPRWETCECATAVQFVIRTLVGPGRARNRIEGIHQNLGGREDTVENGAVLNAENNAVRLAGVLAVTGDYIGLLTAEGASAGSHSCVFVSYGLSSASRSWGFYQANANGQPNFTLCPQANAAGVGPRNLYGLSEAGFRQFFHGLTAGDLPVLRIRNAQIRRWVLQVVSFGGVKMYPR